MYLALFPFFFLRLILSNLIWMVQFGLFYLSVVTSFWYACILSVLTVGMVWFSSPTPLSLAKIDVLLSPTPSQTFTLLSSYALEDYDRAKTFLSGIPSEELPSPLPNLPKKITASMLEMEKSFWLDVAERQPTHRDVLLNLAALHQTLGDETKADDYRARAFEVDPNFIPEEK